MRLIIKETVRDVVPIFTVSGKTLTIGNDVLDWSNEANGSTQEAMEGSNEYFKGSSVDDNGEITVEILFPYNASTYPKGKVLVNELEVTSGVVYPFIDRVKNKGL